MSIPIRPRGLGANIALVFSIIAKNFPKLAIVSLIFGLPALIPQILGILDPEAWTFYLEVEDLDTIEIPYAPYVGMVLGYLFYPFFIGTITGLVTGGYTGENVTVGKSLELAARVFIPLALFALLSNFFIFGGFLVLGGLGGLGLMPEMLAVILIIFMVIPLLMMVAAFYVGSPAIVVERIGVGIAFRRTILLTRNRRLMILGFAFLIGMIASFAASILLVPAVIVMLASGSDEPGIAMLILTWLLQSILGLLNVVAPVVIYFQLRAEKENFQLTSLAELVDDIQARRGPDDTFSDADNPYRQDF